MATEPLLILTAYCVAIVAASLLGGWLPSLTRLTHTATQMIMSAVAGLMLGVALYHLLPHAIVQIGGNHAVDTAIAWVMTGLVIMLLLLRSFHFHQHDFSAQENEHHHHEESAKPGVHPMSWMGLALGLGLHTLIDGVALGASVQSGWSHGTTASVAGLGVFLAILLHKPLDALSITSVMVAGGWSSGARNLANLGFALICPLGALLFYWGAGQLGGERDLVIGSALAFSAGVFMCISLSDLLPEVHFHSHDKGKLTLSFLAGIGLAYALGFIEPAATHAMEALQ
jgi:zinc and cadmium transporter